MEQPCSPYVITIARSFGSGGKYIGTQLSRALGIPCYDDEIKMILEEQYGIHNKLFQNMEDSFGLPSWIQKLRKKPVSEYVAHEERFVSDIALFKCYEGMEQSPNIVYTGAEPNQNGPSAPFLFFFFKWSQ